MKAAVRYLAVIVIALTTQLFAAKQCTPPSSIDHLVTKATLKELAALPDVRRNLNALKGLCVHEVAFSEGKYRWRMVLVTHPKRPKGAFWYLPHDNENSAFDAAVYATRKYGGGFLAVVAGGKRFFSGQDPNRNFGPSAATAKVCRGQHSAAPKYSSNVFRIIDSFRGSGMPYLALHNNANGWSGNGGKGTISILRSTKNAQAYPAFKKISRGNGGLTDEDTLVYIAGKRTKPGTGKLQRLLAQGLNTKYEVVRPARNDCSMSNYVVLTKGTEKYYNLETQHRDTKTQKVMIDRLMQIVR